MSIAQTEIVKRVRFYLGDMPWETTGSCALDGTIEVESDTDWAKGNYGEFEEDGDAFLVRSTEGTELTTIRSYYGSTAAEHDVGSRIFKEPKYKFNEIANATSAVIKGFLPWPRFYKIVPIEITPSPLTDEWYDLADDALGLVTAKQLSDGPIVKRYNFDQRHVAVRPRFERNMPSDLVASGVGIAFPDGFLDNDNTVFVNYAAKITDTVTTGDYVDFSDGDAITEAIILGTVSVLQRALELRKVRNSSDDPDYIRSGRDFNAMFLTALATAEKELRQSAPLMRGWDK